MHLFPREFLVGDHYYNRPLNQWLQIASLKNEAVTTLVTHTDEKVQQVHLHNETQYLVRTRGGRPQGI